MVEASGLNVNVGTEDLSPSKQGPRDCGNEKALFNKLAAKADFSDEDEGFSDPEEDSFEAPPKVKPAAAKAETKKEEEENKDDDEEESPFNELQICDDFKMKESPDGNKVFYMEDDIEFELLKKIGEGGFCKVYKAIGTYC